MILVDTSVLIDYFKGAENTGTQKFQYIQDQNIPFGITHLIFQEVLQGSKNIEEFDLLKEYLQTQIFYDIKNGKKSYADAAKLYMACKKRGFTIRSTMSTYYIPDCN